MSWLPRIATRNLYCSAGHVFQPKYKKVSSPFHIASNACIECGTCVLVCPTGAITLADITGGVRTVHSWESEFEAVDCQVCGHHYLAPQFADHATLLAEPALSRVEGEAVP